MRELILNGDMPSSLHGVLEAIFNQRITGQILIVLHCQNGVAQAADVGPPTPIMAACRRVDFRQPARKSLDSTPAAPPP